MRNFARVLSAGLISLATIGGTYTMAGSGTAHSVIVTCEAPIGASLSVVSAVCETLTGEINRTSPSWQAISTPTDKAADATMTLTLHAANNREVRGELSWTRGNKRGSSPLSGISATDAELEPSMVTGFVAKLLQRSNWHGTL